MRWLVLWLGLALGAGSSLSAQDRATPGHQVSEDFGGALYNTGERTGGSDAEWRVLEHNAVEAINTLAETNRQALVLFNEKGRTPLMQAAAQGHAIIVRALLAYPEVQHSVSTEDDEGLDAYDHALLQFRTTLQGCHPKADNPFALIPYLVTRPYYQSRQPYAEILNLLADHGADTEQETARAVWMAWCSNENDDDRQRIAEAQDVATAISAVQYQVERRKLRVETDEDADLLRELFSPRVNAGKMTQSALDAQIAELYRSKGLEPPIGTKEE
ncbi:MAG: ankyrin repeat domain-containing protein [Paracoccaceae bacterium]